MTIPAPARSHWSEAPTGWRRAVLAVGWSLAFPIVGAVAVLGLAAVATNAALTRLLARAHHRSRRPARRAHT
jgi:hypothetical protein